MSRAYARLLDPALETDDDPWAGYDASREPLADQLYLPVGGRPPWRPVWGGDGPPLLAAQGSAEPAYHSQQSPARPAVAGGDG